MELRPTGPGSVKAHLRIGRSELELGRYREATSVLESLLARTADVSGGKDGKEVEVVGEADRGRAKIFLERCKAGLAKEERNMQKRKVGMRKAFHGDSGGGGGGSKGKSKVKGKSKGK